MSDSADRTTVLVELVQRMQSGDPAARDQLVRVFQERLSFLAHEMLKRYPKVARWVEADDVLQASLVRLLRALESVQPKSTRAFLGLAAEQMRRELLDMYRHFYGPLGLGTHHESGRYAIAQAGGPPPAEFTDDDSDLERWGNFHEAVASLPDREREVVGLIYYHGWTQAQVAELFKVNVRTVRRWWERALVKLHRSLKDDADTEP
jgi:RNA polymerase sigma-70 factor (ECF subfamily)